MIAFEVRVNGRQVCLAGADDLGVLSATLTVGGQLGSRTVRANHSPDSKEISAPFLHVGGLTSRGDGQEEVHLRWAADAAVAVGDCVEIRLVDIPAAAADAPDVEAKSTQAFERRRFLAAKARYFALREKFESP
jgi:hypothetical protein